jgi:hypothetical protein
MLDNHAIANTLKSWNVDAMKCVQDKRYPEAINLFKKALKIEETLQIHREAGQTLIMVMVVIVIRFTTSRVCLGYCIFY